MVINFHVHMMRYQVDWPRELGEFYIKEMFQGDCWHTGKPWRPEDFCVPVERLIKDMDEGKIDKAVVLGVGYMPWNAYDPNSAAYVKSMVDKYPDRLVGFYTGNPTGGYEEAKRLETAVTKFGLRGLKMLPSYNYVALNDRRIWPLYEAAQALKVPVMVHTGWSAMPKGKMLAYDHPLYLEDVMVDFPDLTLVIGHTGFMWAEEVIFFMGKFRNVWGDFAYWAEGIPLWKVAQVWSFAKKMGVMNRFIWGTDYPYVPFTNGLDLFSKVAAYTHKHELEPFITEEDQAGFFGENAARLLGLRESVEVSNGPVTGCP